MLDGQWTDIVTYFKGQLLTESKSNDTGHKQALLKATDHGVHLVPPGAGVGDDGPSGGAPIVVHGGASRGGGDGPGAFCKVMSAS